MTERDPALAPFAALIGTWTTQATHPTFAGVVVPGTVTLEWLEGGRYVVQRSHHDHDAFPDSIGLIGPPEDGDGLVMEYFDSRGVRRTYGVALEDGVLRMWRDDPAFPQRYAATIGHEAFEGLWQTRGDSGREDDLRVVHQRATGLTGELFAGAPVRDFAAARRWYERLLGEPSSMPHATEAVWTLAGGRSIYVVEDSERAGRALITVFVDDLDAAVTEITSRGLEPSWRETYANGVRKVTYRDPDGNEIGLGGAPLVPAP